MKMNCKQADTALMQYAEKNIQHETAAALAKHVLTCESCREVFLLFDEAMETTDEPVKTIPIDFTDTVMTAVRGLPPYAKTAAVGSRADVGARVFWGLCAVLMGVALYGMVNPESIAALLNSYPQAYAVLGALAAFSDSLQLFANQFLSSGSRLGTAASPWFMASTLFFVAIVGTLLAVLVREEKINI
jgi:hypothetical protein